MGAKRFTVRREESFISFTGVWGYGLVVKINEIGTKLFEI